jgi:hypothetical protein
MIIRRRDTPVADQQTVSDALVPGPDGRVPLNSIHGFVRDRDGTCERSLVVRSHNSGRISLRPEPDIHPYRSRRSDLPPRSRDRARLVRHSDQGPRLRQGHLRPHDPPVLSITHRRVAGRLASPYARSDLARRGAGRPRPRRRSGVPPAPKCRTASRSRRWGREVVKVSASSDVLVRTTSGGPPDPGRGSAGSRAGGSPP